MDSSPRPQRRFSRWQTTKRTFVLGGVAYKPTSPKTAVQDNKKPDSVKRTNKINLDKNVDSVTKRQQHNSPLVAKSSVVRRLCLETSIQKNNKDKIIDPTKTTQLGLVTANDVTATDCSTVDKDTVSKSRHIAVTDTIVKCALPDQPSPQDFQVQHEKRKLRSNDISRETEQQNNSNVLLKTSSNKKSGYKSSQSARESSLSAVRTLPSRRKVNVAHNCSTQGGLEAGFTTTETNKRKRQANDDGESSDKSSTDKENETDSGNVNLPSQNKKLKQDGVLQSIPYVSSPEILENQHPVISGPEKKTVQDHKNISKVKDVSCVDIHSSTKRKSAEKTLSPAPTIQKGRNANRKAADKIQVNESGLSEVQDSDTSIMVQGSAFSKRSTSRLGKSNFSVSKTNETSSLKMGSSSNKKDQSKKQSTVKSVVKKNSPQPNSCTEDKSMNTSKNVLTNQNRSSNKDDSFQVPHSAAKTLTVNNSDTPTDVHGMHSENVDSFTAKRGLRDRRLLPTPEQVQQQRRYPEQFLSSDRRSSFVGTSHVGSRQDVSVNKQQKDGKAADVSSQLRKSESSSIATEKIRKVKLSSTRNRRETHSSLIKHTKRKKSSSPVQTIFLSPQETTEQAIQQKESEKVIENTHNSASLLDADKIRSSARTHAVNNNEKKQNSSSVSNVTQNDADSSSVMSASRNHRMLPTSEELQQQQYPVQVVLSSKRSSVNGLSTSSQLKQTKQSSSLTKQVVKEALRKIKSRAHSSSKNRTRKLSPQQTTQQTRTEKLLEHTHSTSAESSVTAENQELNVKNKSGVNGAERKHNNCSATFEESDSFRAKSGLRDRRLLPTPEQLQEQRQYPVQFLLPSKRLSVTGISNSDSRQNTPVNRLQEKVAENPDTSPQLKHKKQSAASTKKIIKEKSVAKIHNGAYSKSRMKKSSSQLHNFSISHHETPQKGRTEKLCKHIDNISTEALAAAENIHLNANTKSSVSGADKKHNSLSVRSATSEESSSFSAKSGLRDRRLLPTPEQLRKQRQYPVQFLLPSKALSVTVMLNPDNKLNTPVKSPEKKLAKNMDAFSQLEQTKQSTASTRIREKSCNSEIHSESKSRHKKHVASTHNFSGNSDETPEPIDWMPVNTHITVTHSRESSQLKQTKLNSTSGNNIQKSHGPKMEDEVAEAQPTLHLSMTAATVGSIPLPGHEQETTQMTQQLLGKDQVAQMTQQLPGKDCADDPAKTKRTPTVNKKPHLKINRRQYSLPRCQAKESLTGKQFVATVDKSDSPLAVEDVSLEPAQLSVTVVDSTMRKPQKPTHMKPQSSSSDVQESHSVGQNHQTAKMPDLAINETVVVPKKAPRRRKLLKELDGLEGSSTKIINAGESKKVMLRSEDGRARKRSHVSALDVILQELLDTEDQLLVETQHDSLGCKLVKKVMRNLKQSIQPLVADVEEIQTLEHEIRQRTSRIRKLTSDVKEQQQLRTQLRSKVQNEVNQDLDLVNVREIMKDYAQLMQAYANRPR